MDDPVPVVLGRSDGHREGRTVSGMTRARSVQQLPAAPRLAVTTETLVSGRAGDFAGDSRQPDRVRRMDHTHLQALGRAITLVKRLE
jgi:hypothetical protein